MPPEPTLERLDEAGAGAELQVLSGLLHACVHAGASVNFVRPFSRDDATRFWTAKVLPGLHAGNRCVWAARAAGRIVGSVQLDHDTPPNQPHRAEVTKLLVHPDWRRRGIARGLMRALEAEARRIGRTLITLDTRTGDNAERLYRALGYVPFGIVPGYSVDPHEPAKLDATTFFYKTLGP